jgi:hypothetical protein
MGDEASHERGDQRSGHRARRIGTDGYPDGTDGYPDGTDGYPVSDHRTDGYPACTDGHLVSDEGPGADPWADLFAWTSEEYPSTEAFIDRILEERAKLQGEPIDRRPPPTLPAPSPPGAELADLPRPQGRPSAARQVGIKLTHADYELLAEAAELYGVAPSTLARMLVRRGAHAVVARGDGSGSD